MKKQSKTIPIAQRVRKIHRKDIKTNKIYNKSLVSENNTYKWNKNKKK